MENLNLMHILKNSKYFIFMNNNNPGPREATAKILLSKKLCIPTESSIYPARDSMHLLLINLGSYRPQLLI